MPRINHTIPVPVPKRASGPTSTRWPFRTMQHGDSVLIRGTPAELLKARVAARMVKRDSGGAKYLEWKRYGKRGIRFWLIVAAVPQTDEK